MRRRSGPSRRAWGPRPRGAAREATRLGAPWRAEPGCPAPPLSAAAAQRPRARPRVPRAWSRTCSAPCSTGCCCPWRSWPVSGAGAAPGHGHVPLCTPQPRRERGRRGGLCAGGGRVPWTRGPGRPHSRSMRVPGRPGRRGPSRRGPVGAPGWEGGRGVAERWPRGRPASAPGECGWSPRPGIRERPLPQGIVAPVGRAGELVGGGGGGGTNLYFMLKKKKKPRKLAS